MCNTRTLLLLIPLIILFGLALGLGEIGAILFSSKILNVQMTAGLAGGLSSPVTWAMLGPAIGFAVLFLGCCLLMCVYSSGYE